SHMRKALRRWRAVGPPPRQEAPSSGHPARRQSIRLEGRTESRSIRGIGRAGMGRRLRAAVELEDNLALPDQTELLTRDTLDRARVFPELLHLGTQAGDIATELGILAFDLLELPVERAHPRHTLRFENEDGHRNQRHREDGER